MVTKYVDTHPQFTVVKNGSFAPNADGQVEFFEVGLTGDVNRRDTYSDAALTTVNPNPMTLDGNGRTVNPVFLSGNYNTVIRDVNGVQQDSVDNVQGEPLQGVTDIVVDIATDLRALDPNDFKSAYVQGDAVVGDGGNGHFTYDADSVESDDSVNVIEPTVGGGRYLRLNQGNNTSVSLAATGTVDEFVISPTPIVTANNITRLYIVKSLGPNTLTSTVGFTVGTATSLDLRRNDGDNLLVGDTGPAGYLMFIQTRSDSAFHILMNPFITPYDRLSDLTASGFLGASAAGPVTEMTVAATQKTLGVFTSKSVYDGLEITTPSTTTVGVDSGKIADSLGSSIMPLTSAFTKSISSNWAAGTAQGGWPSTGVTLTADTWYRVFLIAKADLSAVDVGFDDSSTAANLLADATDYTLYRRVGWFYSNSSSQVLDILPAGKGKYVLDVYIADKTISPRTSDIASTDTITAPPHTLATISSLLTVVVGATGDAAGGVILSQTGQTHSTFGPPMGFAESAIPLETLGDTAISETLLDSSSQLHCNLEVTVNGAGSTAALVLTTLGFEDNLEVD